MDEISVQFSDYDWQTHTHIDYDSRCIFRLFFCCCCWLILSNDRSSQLFGLSTFVRDSPPRVGFFFVV